jgi:hypothetical protein
LPDQAHVLVAGRHAQSVAEADIGVGRPLGGAATTVLRVWETWRICIVELSAVETEALLADGSSDESREDRQGDVRTHVTENRVLGACKRVTRATQNYQQQLREGRGNDRTIKQLNVW